MVESLSSAFAVRSEMGPIDVVVVTRNSEKTVDRCLNSLKNSDVPTRALIIVDGASEDNTLGVVKQIFPEAKILRETVGLAYARYLGVQSVSTPTFMFLDSDSCLPSGKFYAKLASRLRNGVGAVEAFGTNIYRARFQARMRERQRFVADTQLDCRRHRAHTCCTLIRTELLKDWVPPTGVDAGEDVLIGRHITGKGYKWLIANDVEFYHEPVSSNRLIPFGETKHALWHGRGCSRIGFYRTKDAFKILAHTFTQTLDAVRLRCPEVIPSIFFTNLGLVLGILIYAASSLLKKADAQTCKTSPRGKTSWLGGAIV